MARILIIDDDFRLRKSLSTILQEKGYQVDIAENGIEALKRLDYFQPDVILTDISMPDMDGIEFLKIISNQQKNLPVVVMSGNAVGTKFLKAASLFGAAATLEKPFSKIDLISTIEKLI